MKENERKICDYIAKCESEGFDPSIRDICSYMGFTSSATGYSYVNRLVEKGLLIRTGPDGKHICSHGMRPLRVPSVERFSHGAPVFEDLAEPVYFLPDRQNTGQLFAYRISENINRIRASAGDIVIFEMQDYAVDGDIVIVSVSESDVVIEAFSPSENQGISRFTYPEETNRSIIGKAIGLIRFIR